MKLILDGLNAAGPTSAPACSATCGPASRTARACSAPTGSTPTATRRCARTASTASSASSSSGAIAANAITRRLEQRDAVERERAGDLALGEHVAPVARGQLQLDRLAAQQRGRDEHLAAAHERDRVRARRASGS